MPPLKLLPPTVNLSRNHLVRPLGRANLSGHPVLDLNAGALRGRLLPRGTNVVLVAFDHDLSVDERLLVNRGLMGKAKIEAKKDAAKAQPAEAKAADEKASLLMRHEQKAEKLRKQLEKVESSIKRRENLPAPYDFLHVPYRVSQEKARAARRRRRGAPVGALIALSCPGQEEVYHPWHHQGLRQEGEEDQVCLAQEEGPCRR
ncbi:hypothetical protein B0H65DRAFT_474702 [Neurospora tetraspora]|uniref:Uncharacterized protein n=1 Tax=Neurospora tetraspora TaxID=94610 RepID=A0AAE0J8Y8_9PEZI|nr:hypothetical protein B0H65DRAFT_474702 [Neurospora tetraspora]